MKGKKNNWVDWEHSSRLRIYFTKMFGDNSPEGERKVNLFCKKVLFVVVLLIELLILSQYIEVWVSEGKWFPFMIGLTSAIVLVGAETLNLFVLKNERHRLGFYILQACSIYTFVILTEGAYTLLLYMLILTQLYLDIPNGKMALAFLFGALILYSVSYGGSIYLTYEEGLNFFDIGREWLGAMFLLVLHFLISQFIMTFYRQYLQLNRTLAELDAKKKELERANAVVAEVSVLGERQRIAKELHDTAGHSLTTVIMQTEAARRIIDTQPEEAKKKMISANLQAKNTLERLRESVHLLSGSIEGMTFKRALEAIIYESTDGTGVNIRSEIEDLEVSAAKHRFLCGALREGISNGLRHGNATAFWFELKEKEGKLVFLLSDNGRGMQKENVKEGFGLRSMRERVASLGGELRLYSEIEEGFELCITLPLEGKMENNLIV